MTSSYLKKYFERDRQRIYEHTNFKSNTKTDVIIEIKEKSLNPIDPFKELMLMDWKDEYSVEVNEIDEQHKKIFLLINDLYNAIQEMNTKEKLKEILENLIDYAIYHFNTEEKYFDKFKFELTSEHKQEHNQFKKKISDMNEKINNNEIQISFELIDFLEDWIIDHVTDSDQKYKNCLKKNGLK